MTYVWLQVVTASRIAVCVPLWLWCWWKRPRGMVLWMTLAAAWFVASDHLDGQWARAYGLQSELGYCLDHVGDVLFYGSVVLSLVKGSREPPARRPSPPRG